MGVSHFTHMLRIPWLYTITYISGSMCNRMSHSTTLMLISWPSQLSRPGCSPCRPTSGRVPSIPPVLLIMILLLLFLLILLLLPSYLNHYTYS